MNIFNAGKPITRTSKFNKIYVFDFPAREGDGKSGQELYKWLKNRVVQAGVLTERIAITSKKNLIKRLNELADEAEVRQIIPLLHFEGHGNTTGLMVREDEHIDWTHLLTLTRRINVATNNNLILSFAVCHAGFLYAYIDIMKPAAFHGFVSSIHQVHFGPLEVGYNTFFDVMLGTSDMNKALDRLNFEYQEQSVEQQLEAPAGPAFEFKLAELFFEMAWHSYEEVWQVEAERMSRTNDQMLWALRQPELRNRYSITTLRYLIEKANTTENRQGLKAQQRRVFMMEH